MSFVELVIEEKELKSESVAAEIVKLERRMPGPESSAKETEEAARRLRQRKLGGKSVKDEELKEADVAASAAVKDCDVARLSLDELMGVLLEEVGREKSAKIQQLKELAYAKRAEYKPRRAALVKEFAAFFIKWREVVGGVPGQPGALYFEFDATSANPNLEERVMFKNEVERLLGGPLKFSRGLEGEADRALNQAYKIAMKTSRQEVAETFLKAARKEAARKEAERSDKKEDK